MNLLLFDDAELAAPLARQDRRAQHVLDVLRRKPGDTFDVGRVDGPRGKATLVAIGSDALTLSFAWGLPPPPLEPIRLIVGLPRPQTARDILRDATTLGVAELHFVITGKGDVNYASSSLWHSGEARRHLLAGAAQAFDTRLPLLIHGESLTATLAGVPAGGTRLALDNYEAAHSFGEFPSLVAPVTLAIGPERGWSSTDRDHLRSAGFALAHLGPRVLRTETAAIAAITLARAKLGCS